MKGLAAAALVLAALALAGPAGAQPAAAAEAADPATLVVVAVADRPAPLPGAGSTPRLGYRRLPSYAGSDRALADAADVARRFGLQEVAGWTIAPLGWRCMLYRVAPGTDRDTLVAQLAADPRVTLAQPLNEFRTLTAAPSTPYNDPYLALQSGLAAMQAVRAHAASTGSTVRIAVIDSAVDARHPDLAGRVVEQRDFVAGERDAPAPAAAAELHGTQVAGVMAANAHNGLGIVGVAPQAQLLAYRACWSVAEGGARCNSFTLARALAAAAEAKAEVINLSLAGPRDALLEALARHAMKRGAIVVGALPPAGAAAGFPAAVPGVIAVADGPWDKSQRAARKPAGSGRMKRAEAGRR
jgi:subtilisin family serine protease